MLKTIKKNVQMRLDELIKYVWDNEYKNREYYSKDGILVDFMNRGDLSTDFFVSKDEVFTVEVEEPITEDTVFNTLVDVNSNDEVNTTKNVSVGLYAKEQTKEIHALIDGKLQLIWEADSDEL